MPNPQGPGLVERMAEEERRYVEPDATDIRLLANGLLPKCPCCSGTPTTFARYFPHSGIYQSYVNCSQCSVQVFKNARDREEARDLAIAAWSKRPKPDARAMLAELREPTPEMLRAGAKRSNFEDPTFARLNAGAIWKAMIDAITGDRP